MKLKPGSIDSRTPGYGMNFSAEDWKIILGCIKMRVNVAKKLGIITYCEREQRLIEYIEDSAKKMGFKSKLK